MSAAREWGVFAWRADGVYRRADAVQVFKTERGARNAAARAYERDADSALVARPIFL